MVITTSEALDSKCRACQCLYNGLKKFIGTTCMNHYIYDLLLTVGVAIYSKVHCCCPLGKVEVSSICRLSSVPSNFREHSGPLTKF